MQALRASAAAAPAGEPLTWARAGAENADELSDWTIKLGAAALWKVHTAVVASGPRCSEKIRAQAIAAAKGDGARTTDVLQLISSEPARAAIQKDAHSTQTFEVLLTWMYGSRGDFSLPSLGGNQTAAPVAAAAAATPGGTAAEGADAASVLDMFSVAIFGTPTKGGGPPTSPSRAATDPRTTAPPARKGANGVNAGVRALALKPEQLPLLWQLAGALGVRGLKARLAPVLELHALPPNFVMETAAFERLKLLVRALELHAQEIVGALCEQLKLSTESSAALREGMCELAVAAGAVDVGRYEALVACGLLPASDTKRLSAILDRSSLRVANEVQVHDFLLAHLKAAPQSAAVQEGLWATCRFSFLGAAQLVALAERPNVPARWLALACAQRSADGSKVGLSAASGADAARLKPRDFYQ